jgi:hypothetical protein
MRYFSCDAIPSDLGSIRWLLAYTTVDVDVNALTQRLRARFPGVPVFGCTSFQGVFTPEGFKRGAWALAGDTRDDVQMLGAMAVWNADATDCAVAAATALKAQLNGLPPALLLAYPTPGAEEAMLRGVASVFGSEVPIYGGSAADDDVSGQWKIFCDGQTTSRGIVLIAVRSQHAILADFLSGYLPTRHRGYVTGALGRRVLTIDDKPAAQVYNDWTQGALGDTLQTGGVVLAETTLSPLARVKARVGGVAFHLLSHPCEVSPKDGSLTFFTDFQTGDEVTLMRGNPQSLINRVEQVGKRALSSSRPPLDHLSGGVLIYCGGCVGAVRGHLDEIAARFHSTIFNAPFLGAATFGEQGRALGTGENWHGNLMCSAVLMA